MKWANFGIYVGIESRSAQNMANFGLFSHSEYNLAMHDIPNRIADVLLEVEATLRMHGKWDEKTPTRRELASAQPFCMDTLSFEQWLQWVFLPRMRSILEHTRPLPDQSGIFAYAEEYLHKNDPSTSNLLSLIKRFDDLITLQSSAKRH